jgi:hypothetical protein
MPTSGALQHRVGCEAADVIVAINTDVNAPIFEFAHQGTDRLSPPALAVTDERQIDLAPGATLL